VTGTDVTAGRPALDRWRWTVTAAFGLGGITISAWGPRLPAIKTDLRIGLATIGLLLAGVTVGAILGLLASTPVLHRLGSRRAIAGALLLTAVAMTLMGVALSVGSVPLVAVAFVTVGLGIGVLDVLINVEGSAVERAAGRTLMPMMHAAWSIGAAVVRRPGRRRTSPTPAGRCSGSRPRPPSPPPSRTWNSIRMGSPTSGPKYSTKSSSPSRSASRQNPHTRPSPTTYSPWLRHWLVRVNTSVWPSSTTSGA
jgi:hypothetical protein